MPGPLGRIADLIAGAAGGIDWSGTVALAFTGLLVGGVAFAIAIGIAYWIRHTDAAAGASGAASAAASQGLRRFRRARGAGDTGRWLCGRCRSWNPPGSGQCYRGCGRREDVRLLLPGEVARQAPPLDGPGAADGSEDAREPAEATTGAGEGGERR